MTTNTEWTRLAEAVSGNTSHPGLPYHDVGVEIGMRRRQYRVDVVETWGMNQGRLQEHGRRRIVAIDPSLDVAVRLAEERSANMECECCDTQCPAHQGTECHHPATTILYRCYMDDRVGIELCDACVYTELQRSVFGTIPAENEW